MSKTELAVGPRGGIRWPSLLQAMLAKSYDPQDGGLERLASVLSANGDVVTSRTVESWLRGQREPTLGGLEQLAKALGTTAAILLDDRPKKVYPD